MPARMYAIKKKSKKGPKPRAKRGFTLSNPFTGKPFVGATWRAAPRARASNYLASMRPSRSAGRIMKSAMKMGSTYNRGALAMGDDNGIVTIKHREFLGVVNSSIGFETQVYELNPGLDRLLPWGSAIARSFQQYEILAMTFEFISTSATSLVNGSNTALGQVALATQYNSLEPEFLNLNDVLNSQFAVSTKISSDLLHAIEVERIQTTAQPLYVRSGRAPGDIRLYDIGRVTLATYGAQASNQIGQLFVSYTIRLLKPQSTNQDGGNAESAFLSCWASNSAVAPISQLNPLGTAYAVDVDSIGVSLSQVAGGTSITLPAGSSGWYLLGLAYWGNTLRVAPTPGTFTLTNCTLQNDFWGRSPFVSAAREIAGVDSVPADTFNPNFTYIINVLDPTLPAVLAFTPNTWNVADCARDVKGVVNVYIAQLNTGFQNFVQPADTDACCASLQEQIAALAEQLAALQAHEAESDVESEEEERKDEERFREIEHRLDKCCGEPKKPPMEAAAVAVPSIAEQRAILLEQLRVLDSPSSPLASPQLM